VQYLQEEFHSSEQVLINRGYIRNGGWLWNYTDNILGKITPAPKDCSVGI
jgi:hypothetical protein